MSLRPLRMCVVLALMLLVPAVSACKDEKATNEAEAAPEEAGPEAWDEAAMKAGEAKTMNLKFWMTGSHYEGNDKVDNLHFDADGHERVVFKFDPALADTVAGLEQGKLYKVTFTYESSPDSPLQKGTISAIE